MHIESTLTGFKKFSGIKTILLRPSSETVFQPMQLERSMLLILLPLFAMACVALGLADVLMDKATWFERYQLLPMAVGPSSFRERVRQVQQKVRLMVFGAPRAPGIHS